MLACVGFLGRLRGLQQRCLFDRASAAIKNSEFDAHRVHKGDAREANMRKGLRDSILRNRISWAQVQDVDGGHRAAECWAPQNRGEHWLHKGTPCQDLMTSCHGRCMEFLHRNVPATNKIRRCVLISQDLKSTDPEKMHNKNPYTASIPGPDKYTTRGKTGQGKPAISFTRESKAVSPYVSLSKRGADALLRGYLSPGPNYSGHPSFGLQNETMKRNSAVTKFNKASRFPNSSGEKTPGPGMYVA